VIERAVSSARTIPARKAAKLKTMMPLRVLAALAIICSSERMFSRAV
jgi:hypothetical protein